MVERYDAFIDRKVTQMDMMAEAAVASELEIDPYFLMQRGTLVAGWLPVSSRRVMRDVMLAAGESPERVSFVDEHERQHKFAAEIGGVTLFGYGVEVAADIASGLYQVTARTGGIGYVDPGLSELHRAAIAVYPDELSEGDIAVAHALGWEGVDHVAYDVARHNLHSNSPIPMPRSVQAVNRITIPL